MLLVMSFGSSSVDHQQLPYFNNMHFLASGKVRPADKLQLKAAKILLPRSKQDPTNRGHGAQYLYRPPPAGATTNTPSILGFLASKVKPMPGRHISWYSSCNTCCHSVTTAWLQFLHAQCLHGLCVFKLHKHLASSLQGVLMQDGVWDGERILPKGWVKYSTTPGLYAGYGAGLWLGYPGVSLTLWKISERGFYVYLRVGVSWILTPMYLKPVDELLRKYGHAFFIMQAATFQPNCRLACNYIAIAMYPVSPGMSVIPVRCAY